MIVQVMAISNLVLTRQIYSEETNGAHAHYREPVPLKIPDEVFSSIAPILICRNLVSENFFDFLLAAEVTGVWSSLSVLF